MENKKFAFEKFLSEEGATLITQNLNNDVVKTENVLYKLTHLYKKPLEHSLLLILSHFSEEEKEFCVVSIVREDNTSFKRPSFVGWIPDSPTEAYCILTHINLPDYIFAST